MKRFYRYVGSTDPALEQAPEVFDSVGMHAAFDVSLSVVDHVMHVGVLTVRQVLVLDGFVGVDGRAVFNLFGDVRHQAIAFGIGNDFGPHFAASAIQDAHDHGFAKSSAAFVVDDFLVLVHVPQFSADESFVYFDFVLRSAPEFVKAANLQGETNAVHHEPSGLLSDADGAVNFVAAHAVFAIGNHPHGYEPFVQRDRRIFEDGIDLDGELPFGVLRFALPDSASGKKANFLGAATRTEHAVTEATSYEEIQAVVGIGEVDDCGLKGLGIGCHDPILAQLGY